MFFRAQVRRALQRVPGKQRFGIYRFLPFFFVLGGTMEWIMIKVRVGQETFCFLPEMFRMQTTNHLSLDLASIPSKQRFTAFGGRSSTKTLSPWATLLYYLST
nr:small integral membrane protein 4 isoform X2 [Peromyscus maniculatus bairdii]